MDAWLSLSGWEWDVISKEHIGFYQESYWTEWTRFGLPWKDPAFLLSYSTCFLEH